MQRIGSSVFECGVGHLQLRWSNRKCQTLFQRTLMSDMDSFSDTSITSQSWFCISFNFGSATDIDLTSVLIHSISLQLLWYLFNKVLQNTQSSYIILIGMLIENLNTSIKEKIILLAHLYAAIHLTVLSCSITFTVSLKLLPDICKQMLKMTVVLLHENRCPIAIS